MVEPRFAVVAKAAPAGDLAAAFCSRLTELDGVRLVPHVVESHQALSADLVQVRCEVARAPPRERRRPA